MSLWAQATSQPKPFTVLKLFLPPNPPLKQFEAQGLSVYAEGLIVGIAPSECFGGGDYPMRKSFPKGIPWSSTPTLEVDMGAARRGEFACRGRALPSPTDVSCTGGGTVLDPRCVGHHGAREARRPMRSLDDLSEGSPLKAGFATILPWVMEFFVLRGCVLLGLRLKESLKGLQMHMLST